MKQGGKDWHIWRLKGIGASDVPVIMNASPWKKPYDLYLEKIGEKEPFQGNEWTTRGNALEPIAREIYNKTYLCNMEPATLEYKEWPVLRCSLDGIDYTQQRIIEIKCPGEKDHQAAVNGEIPAKYVSQVQAQLLISGMNEAHYVSYYGSEIAVVIVDPDPILQVKIVESCKNFWEYVINKSMESPDLPIYNEIDVFSNLNLFLRYEFLISQISDIEKELKGVKEQITALAKGENTQCGAFYVTYSERRGTIDYSKIPELKSIDLEKYRKSPVKIMSIKREND